MSNLYKQVKGEWVALNEQEEDKVWSGNHRTSPLETLRSFLHLKG